ncbi:uncharacterized protein LOC117192470 [Drosophila miranda]|uniref:uncharacterized protein LOC117192470 n=1 Tax=Drosophila miranda TaxID=7229 RepID=UPI00143F48AC|nr:uncharacterized protein LOC117192470 [Drosophila miranda]
MSSSQERAQLAGPIMKVMQLNLNHCAAAQDLLSQSLRELAIDLAILSEPYQTRESPGFILDDTKKAAIWLCGATPLQLSLSSAAAGFVRAKVGGTLDNLAADARGRHPVAIGGDFYAWAEEWGSVATNARGRALLEIIAPLDIALLHEGNQHTFSRAGIGSVIDLTFVSSSLFNSSGWSISNIYTGSDHRAII